MSRMNLSKYPATICMVSSATFFFVVIGIPAQLVADDSTVLVAAVTAGVLFGGGAWVLERYVK